MTEIVIVFAIMLAIGYTAHKNGKKTGSRRGFAAGPNVTAAASESGREVVMPLVAAG